MIGLGRTGNRRTLYGGQFTLNYITNPVDETKLSYSILTASLNITVGLLHKYLHRHTYFPVGALPEKIGCVGLYAPFLKTLTMFITPAIIPQ